MNPQEQRIADLENEVVRLRKGLEIQEQQNIGNMRLGPKPPWKDADWIEAGNKLGEKIIAECQRRKAMHYRNGREAKNGDKIVHLGAEHSHAPITAVGILFDAKPGNDYCNGSIASTIGGPVAGACLCDCLHADDLAAILAEKGLDKRPGGK